LNNQRLKKLRQMTGWSSAAVSRHTSSGGEFFGHPVRVKAVPSAYPFFFNTIRSFFSLCKYG